MVVCSTVDAIMSFSLGCCRSAIVAFAVFEVPDARPSSARELSLLQALSRHEIVQCQADEWTEMKPQHDSVHL